MAFILEATKWKESSRLFLLFPSTSGEVVAEDDEDEKVVVGLFAFGFVAVVEVRLLLCFVYEMFPYSLRHGQIVSRNEQKSLLIPNHPVVKQSISMTNQRAL